MGSSWSGIDNRKEVVMWARNHSSLNTVANVVTAVMAVLIALKLY
jgi:hypothetical protein